MPRPAYRSRKGLRIIKVRTPGGRLVYHYEKRKYNPPRCAVCKRVLNMPKMTPKEARKGFRTPGRPYAGFLDHRCLREGIKKAVRLMAGAMQ